MNRLISLLPLLVACGGMKSVPTEALAEVPSGQVTALADVQEVVDSKKRDLDETIERHEEIERNLADAQRAMRNAAADLDETKKSRARAVGEGDFTTAQSLGDDLSAAEETYDRRKARYEEQRAMLDLTGQAVDVRAARLKAQKARLETERAAAAARGGADVKVEKYERQEEKFRSRVEKEQSELQALESEYGVQL